MVNPADLENRVWQDSVVALDGMAAQDLMDNEVNPDRVANVDLQENKDHVANPDVQEKEAHQVIYTLMLF